MEQAIKLAAQPSNTRSAYRITSIDLLRGLVMIIMALDHTRDLFHKDAFTGNPLDLSTTTPILFFTRWITHFCAPVFVFLSGTSVWLQSRRKTKSELGLFLIKRGLWLIFLEATLISFGILFDIHFGMLAMQTIWAIGMSMLILGLLSWLPFTAILALGIIIVFGHDALDFAEKTHGPVYPFWWNFIHRPSFYPLGGGHTLGFFYPFLPWTGLMMLGYCFGKIFTQIDDAAKRKLVLLWLGTGIILFMIMLRVMDVYGDPGHWSSQKNIVFTFFSFINYQKYPPSLLYMCATIGPAILFLALVGERQPAVARFITVYGRVPLFYYVLHFYLLHLISAICFLSRGHSFAEGINGVPGMPFKFIIPGEGYSLGIVYLIWISVVLALYPLCKWYSDYKLTHKQWWLSYL